MKVATTTAGQLADGGRRLDASYHAGEGVAAGRFIQQWAGATPLAVGRVAALREHSPAYGSRRVDTLCEVCLPDGLFIPGRFKRVYVDDPAHGVPYLTGSSIVQTDPLLGAKLLSTRHTLNLDELALRNRMILITCSGTIGNCVYVNGSFAGVVGSPDLIRVIADPRQIRSGYLYAWLSSPLARALIQQKTYGAVVPHIEAHHVVDLPVPRLDPATEARIHDLVEQSARLREQAYLDLARLVGLVNTALLGLPHAYKSRWPEEWSYAVGSVSFQSQNRLDAFYHTGHAVEYMSYVGTGPCLGDIASVQLPGKFKRMYVDRDGIPYLSGVDVYQIRVEPRLWLAKRQPELPELLIDKPGLILVQADGQRYGLLGRPAWADESMVGSAASNHLARIRVVDPAVCGYIFLFLSTEAGRRALIRESYGTSIPTIPRAAFERLRIPQAESELARRLGNEAQGALELRTRARRAEDEAQELLVRSLKA